MKKGVSKFYQAEKEIRGTVYKAQFNGLSAALKAVDGSYIEGSSNTSVEKLSDYILKNVIVDPKVCIDDFDDMEEFNEVIAFGREVMQGRFRSPADARAGQEKGGA